MPKVPIILLTLSSPSGLDKLELTLGKLPPSSTERLRIPAQHSSWCALNIAGKTTCDCDWFEKEARSKA